jgi:hypothetical protein
MGPFRFEIDPAGLPAIVFCRPECSGLTGVTAVQENGFAKEDSMAHPDRHLIVVVHISDRLRHASQVQDLFTKYGCNIKTRLGLHEVSDDYCSPNGIVVLEMAGDLKVCEAFAAQLNAIEGVETKSICFDHD